jgi:hypothetical protein
MFRKTVVTLDIIALLLSAVWILHNLVRGLSTSDLMFSYLYAVVVMVAFILTLVDKRGEK